jgi:uroporphyrinogen III methyltransferase/synthase
LFPRAPEGREVIVEALSALGARVDAVAVYRIRAAEPADAAKIAELEHADVFTFLSGETLRAFLEVVPEEKARALLAKSKVAVIGPVARARAEALGIRVDFMPETATIEALVEALSTC